MAVEDRARISSTAAPPAAREGAPLDDAEQRARPRRRAPRPIAGAQRSVRASDALGRLAGRRGRRGTRRAHADVDAERVLDRDGRLGDRNRSEPSTWERNSTPSSAIFRRLARLQTWKPPLVREDRTVPRHESMEPAELAHDVVTGAEEEVIGVGEDDPGARRSQLVGVEAFTVPSVATGMKAGVSICRGGCAAVRRARRRRSPTTARPTARIPTRSALRRRTSRSESDRRPRGDRPGAAPRARRRRRRGAAASSAGGGSS